MVNITLFDKIKNDYNPEKDKPEKFLASLDEDYAYPENVALLQREDINIKLKPSQWMVLGIEPVLLEKTVLQAKDLGFLEAYQQNPAFLKQAVEKIVKRISECEALGIEYKNEKGKYQPWLFSNRGYAYVLKEKAPSKAKEVEAEEEHTLDIGELKENVDRVIETFALESERDLIYSRLTDFMTSEMSMKEILMQIFGEYADNKDYLSTSIDEIMGMNEEEKMGRVA